jgi:hypothetical protein
MIFKLTKAVTMNKSNDEKDPIDFLSNIERIENLNDEEAKNELIHLAEQFKVRYKYLVGEWAGNRRAKSTINGKFVTKEEVIKYLDNIS